MSPRRRISISRRCATSGSTPSFPEWAVTKGVNLRQQLGIDAENLTELLHCSERRVLGALRATGREIFGFFGSFGRLLLSPSL